MQGHYEKIFRFFEEICCIPRGSGNEEAISNYLAAFAKERGLYVIQDEYKNVVIKKPGIANTEPLIIQGHMDMVCEKNKDTDHDFTRDPISLRTEGDYLSACGTTLGADNGIALAMALALLDTTGIPHPDLEVLFTADEEAGMTGAFHLDYSVLKGRRLLNLDSEDEGIFYMSCAGGVIAMFSIPLAYIPAPAGHKTYNIRVEGLKGGHSGMEIHLERGNSIRLLGRVLYSLDKQFTMHIAHIMGGMKDNAIPREAEACITVDENDFMGVQAAIVALQGQLAGEYRGSDPGLRISIEPAPLVAEVFSRETGSKAIAAIMLIPNGVQAMSMDIPGIVETSNNIGVIHTEPGQVVIDCLVRSSVVSRKKDLADRMQLVANVLGAEIKFCKDYPAWEYNPDSALCSAATQAFVDLYGKEPLVTAIHAGLECGIFAERVQGMDIISLGPDVRNAHTPDEMMSISSTKRVWDYLLKLLKRLSE